MLSCRLPLSARVATLPVTLFQHVACCNEPKRHSERDENGFRLATRSVGQWIG